jgi:hypothetical protein
MSKATEVVAEWTIGQKVNRTPVVSWSVQSDDNEQWRKARDLGLNVEFKKRRVL